MKVFLSVKDEEMIEPIELVISKGEVQFINRKDVININNQSYVVNDKSIYFTSNNFIDYIVFHVEKI